MQDKIKVLLVDDHKIFLDGLEELLSKDGNFRIVGKASSGREALSLISTCNPDIVVMDISMPDINGIETTKIIAKNWADVKVIALSMHLDKGMISGVLQAGARGYILKECSIDEFIRGIKAVSDGQVYLTPKVAAIVLEDYLALKKSNTQAAEHKLTSREVQVLKLLVKGEHTKAIASKLSISKSTVDTHRRNIMEKLNCSNIADLTRYALREGLIDLDDD
mgnify:CR=1 FL=1